ncbi:MAG: permease [Thermomicrobiales bacterium]
MHLPRICSPSPLQWRGGQGGEVPQTHAHPHPHAEHDHAREPFAAKVRAVCEHSAIEFFEMGKFLVFGAMLASLLQSLIPRSTLLSIGHSPVGSVLTMVVLAVVLSVCSTVDAFLVLTFASTFTTGALLAFLVFGPMADIKSTLMFLTVFKGRAVALMIVLAAQLVLLATIFINLNIA